MKNYIQLEFPFMRENPTMEELIEEMIRNDQDLQRRINQVVHEFCLDILARLP